MRQIAAFLKFGQRAHLEDLRKGTLYLNPLSCFQKMEFDEAGRSDPHEGLQAVYQAKERGFVISINGHEIPPKDLAGPVILTRTALSDVHAFCLFAITPGEYEVEDQVYDRNQLKIKFDSSFEKFGGHVLYTKNASEFLERIRTAIEKARRRARLALVEYVNKATFHGNIPEDRIGFYKMDTFKAQREYRVLLYGSGKPNEPIRFEVGDLSDITEIVQWSELDVKLQKNDE